MNTQRNAQAYYYFFYFTDNDSKAFLGCATLTE